jgi:hypothetical protein
VRIPQETRTIRTRRESRLGIFWSTLGMHDDSLLPKGPLDRYVGSWQGEVSVDGAMVEPHSYTQSNTFAWVLEGRFLEERGTGTNGSSFIGLWSFGARAGRYRAHYFLAPTGDIVAITHDWNEHTHTFVGAADLGGGIQLFAEDRFIGRDAYEWSTTIADSKGKILTRLRARERRVG